MDIVGIVEGITEWLSVSSTGHLILIDQSLKSGSSDSFQKMLFAVIQLGAIMAVVILYWRKLMPVSLLDESGTRKQTVPLWGQFLISSDDPAAVIGVLDALGSRALPLMNRTIAVYCKMTENNDAYDRRLMDGI